MREGHPPTPTPATPRTPRGRRCWPRQGWEGASDPRPGLSPESGKTSARWRVSSARGPSPQARSPGPGPPRLHGASSLEAGGQLQCPARARGKLVAFRSPPAPPPRQTPPSVSAAACGAGGVGAGSVVGVGVPVGPEVSPDSGTARWGPGCNRACKSGRRTTEGRGREPRGAGRFLPWFSGNWAGQDGKVLGLARTM